MILGLDLSLTAPGIAYADVAETLRIPNIKGISRLGYWRDSLTHVLRTVAPSVVVLEGYSFGSKGQGVVQIGELGGLVRLLMADAGIPYVEVAPSKVKKYATGKGNARKGTGLKSDPTLPGTMIYEAIAAGLKIKPRTVGLQTVYDDNAVDAWWLMQMGLAHYEPNSDRLRPRPVANRTALVGIDWPKRKANA